MGILRKVLYFLLLFLFLLFSIIIAISAGTVQIPFWDVVNALFGYGDELTRTIVVNIRAARVLLAIATGVALGTSGAVVQSIFQNPLAEPYILGISAGSVFGVMLSLLVFPEIPYSGQAFSFFLAMLSILTVYRIAGIGGSIQPSTLILAGIAITALFSAITSYLIYAHFSKNIANILFWTMGGFWHADLFSAVLVLFVAVGCSAGMLLFWKQLNAMALGDGFALSVGVDVARTRFVFVLLVSLSVSFAVSFTGIIGFVGLVVPHIARMVGGAEHKNLLLFSGLIGAVLLLWADTVSRNIIYGEEIPVGIITAILGVPFFLYLLARRRRFC
ncbi:MAG: iron ABC transporter permease [Thermoplasmata archaeon]|nr:iron ABC transporter permease [Thermoplasmata archaeon]